MNNFVSGYEVTCTEGHINKEMNKLRIDEE